MIARIRRVSTLLLLGIVCLAGSAHAQLDSPYLVISSGSEDGNYHRIASRMQAQLSAQYQEFAVGHRDGGPAVTYGYMTRLEPGLRNSRPLYLDVMESLLLLKRGESDPNIKGAMVVQRPRILSAPLELALEHPKDFRIIQIRPGEMQSTSLPDGSDVYTYEKVNLRGSTIATLCTRGLLLAANDKIDKEKLAVLSSLLLKSLEQIAPGAR